MRMYIPGGAVYTDMSVPPDPDEGDEARLNLQNNISVSSNSEHDNSTFDPDPERNNRSPTTRPSPVSPLALGAVGVEDEVEQTRLRNEANDTVLDAVYEQAPDKIKALLVASVGQPKGFRFRVSDLTQAELSRLTRWLVEHRPLAESEIKEYDGSTVCRLWSVEEQNNCGAGSEPVYPGAHHPHMPSPEHTYEEKPTKGKKCVERTTSVLGKGSFGTVRVVKHEGQCYAAKELDVTDPQFMSNLYREAANLALLTHDNIVSYCGIGVYQGGCKGTLLILTELLATSLYRYLKEGADVTLPNQFSILMHILNGLEYMHRDPCMIHGDIKTRNVLLSKDGIAKIADLGSSHLANDVSTTQGICGTPSYLAPETARNIFTEKLDVFAYSHLSLVTLTRWNICVAEFSKPQSGCAGWEVQKRREMFEILECESRYVIVRRLFPLIEACLSDEPNQRPPLDKLKSDIRSLRLPRELPNICNDTAVRNEV